jgi:DHA2 family multidrug resistance protein
MAYSNDFLLMCVVTLVAFPLLLLLRKPKPAVAAPAPTVHAD